MKDLQKFWAEEDGMGTVEIVLIIAALVAIALIFRNAIGDFISNATSSVFSNASSQLTTDGKIGG